MTIDEAITRCSEKAVCDNTLCSLDHIQLRDWLVELKNYRERYGFLESMHTSIILTKSNLEKIKVRCDEIVDIKQVEGKYKGNIYHSRINFNTGYIHYFIETIEEIKHLISKS